MRAGVVGVRVTLPPPPASDTLSEPQAEDDGKGVAAPRLDLEQGKAVVFGRDSHPTLPSTDSRYLPTRMTGHHPRRRCPPPHFPKAQLRCPFSMRVSPVGVGLLWAAVRSLIPLA